MSYSWKKAAGYNGIEGNEHHWQAHENDYQGEDVSIANLRGPKDWIVKYPINDPDSGNIIGFRCLEDDIPRNSLTGKCEGTPKSASMETDLGSNSRLQRGEARIKQVLGQCNYIASMKGMDVAEIRQKLHEDEQEFLQQHRAKKADCGPVYYFLTPPPLKTNERQTGIKENIYRNECHDGIVSGKDKSYDSISSEDEYSQEFGPDLPKCCEVIDPDTTEDLRNFSRGILSPTDYEEEDANINHFFNIVQRIQDKCEKVKVEDKNSKKVLLK